MNRRQSLVFIFSGLVVMCAGCTLGEIHGDRCPDWVAVYEDGIPFDPASSSSEAQDARKDGHCPDNYICSLNGDKQRICRTKCDENSHLCNEKCLNSDKYTFSFTTYEGLSYCEATSLCPSSCANGCDESGACRCSLSCVNGCDEAGACRCPASCTNGCDETGKCLCRNGCVNGCDETGACKCKSDCVNECDETGACRCPSDCTTSCSENGECKCNDKCRDVCRPTGECICQKGDAVCTSAQDVKECYDNVWVPRTCPVGCQQGSDDNRDACIPFVCHDGDVQCKPESNRIAQKCKDNTWQDEQTECQFGCYNGECMAAEFLQLDPDNASIRLLATSLTTENTKSVVAKYVVNAVLTPVDLGIISSDVNCVVIDKRHWTMGQFRSR